jgi:hypothetical protein
VPRYVNRLQGATLGFVTNDMTWPPPATTPARQLAAERAEQIRLGFQSTAVLYARAVEEKDWHVLGYRSVAAWASAEFGPDRFSAERRKEIVALLTAAGHTQRKIAAAARTSKGTVNNDQQEIRAQDWAQESTEPDAELSSDGAPPLPSQTPRQQAARNREAARREHAGLVPDEGPVDADDLNCVCSCGRCGPGGRHDCGTPACFYPVAGEPEEDPADADVAAYVRLSAPALTRQPPSTPQRQLSDAQIEEIIAGDLGRGQIVARYGVGEHAAQLARTAAVAIMGERRRVRHLVSELRKDAEAYLEFRRGTRAPDTVETDRVKISQFLDWLAERTAP